MEVPLSCSPFPAKPLKSSIKSQEVLAVCRRSFLEMLWVGVSKAEIALWAVAERGMIKLS